MDPLETGQVMVVVLPWLCHFAILVSLGGGGGVDAGKVPGVNLEKIKVWDKSASKEAWGDLDGYLDWRSYFVGFGLPGPPTRCDG